MVNENLQIIEKIKKAINSNSFLVTVLIASFGAFFLVGIILTLCGLMLVIQGS
jgi:hypothetical protein